MPSPLLVGAASPPNAWAELSGRSSFARRDVGAATGTGSVPVCPSKSQLIKSVVAVILDFSTTKGIVSSVTRRMLPRAAVSGNVNLEIC
jgi:hypothetical protein